MSFLIRFIVVFFTLFLYTHADDKQLASSLLYKVAQALTSKQTPNVYLHHKEKIKFDFDFSKFSIVNNCKQADIVILPTTKELQRQCRKKILFGTNIKTLKQRRVIGAFFWQKGRPNMILYKKRLQQKRIKLDRSFSKYIE